MQNTVPGDTSALKPHGVRIGTPAMTTRGMDPDGFQQVAEILVDVIESTQDGTWDVNVVDESKGVLGVPVEKVNEIKERVKKLVDGLEYVC